MLIIRDTSGISRYIRRKLGLKSRKITYVVASIADGLLRKLLPEDMFSCTSDDIYYYINYLVDSLQYAPHKDVGRFLRITGADSLGLTLSEGVDKFDDLEKRLTFLWRYRNTSYTKTIIDTINHRDRRNRYTRKSRFILNVLDLLTYIRSRTLIYDSDVIVYLDTLARNIIIWTVMVLQIFRTRLRKINIDTVLYALRLLQKYVYLIPDNDYRILIHMVMKDYSREIYETYSSDEERKDEITSVVLGSRDIIVPELQIEKYDVDYTLIVLVELNKTMKTYLSISNVYRNLLQNQIYSEEYILQSRFNSVQLLNRATACSAIVDVLSNDLSLDLIVDIVSHENRANQVYMLLTTTNNKLGFSRPKLANLEDNQFYHRIPLREVNEEFTSLYIQHLSEFQRLLVYRITQTLCVIGGERITKVSVIEYINVLELDNSISVLTSPYLPKRRELLEGTSSSIIQSDGDGCFRLLCLFAPITDANSPEYIPFYILSIIQWMNSRIDMDALAILVLFILDLFVMLTLRLQESGNLHKNSTESLLDVFISNYEMLRRIDRVDKKFGNIFTHFLTDVLLGYRNDIPGNIFFGNILHNRPIISDLEEKTDGGETTQELYVTIS